MIELGMLYLAGILGLGAFLLRRKYRARHRAVKTFAAVRFEGDPRDYLRYRQACDSEWADILHAINQEDFK